MSAIVHPSPRARAAAHRAVLLLAVLAVAVAVAAAVLVPLLLSRDAAPATGPGGSVPAVDDRCAEVGPATPC